MPGAASTFDGKAFVATAPCPAYTVPEWIASAVAAKEAADNQKIAALSAKMNKDANQLAATQQKVADQVAAEQSDAANLRAYGPGSPIPGREVPPLPGEEHPGETSRFGALALRLWSPLLQAEQGSW